MYAKTNGKNAEHLISLQDENKEAMARIQMAINEWRCSQEDTEIDDSERKGLQSAVSLLTGSRPRSAEIPAYAISTRAFEIRIEICKVIYLKYQLRVDWRNARDIIRCNSKFHSTPRFNSIIYEMDCTSTLAMGQLRLVFCCHLPGGAELDLAMVHPFNKTAWQPKTPTDCPILQRALLCPIMGAQLDMHYIVDCINGDIQIYYFPKVWSMVGPQFATAWDFFQDIAECLSTPCKPSQGLKWIQDVASNLGFFRHSSKSDTSDEEISKPIQHKVQGRISAGTTVSMDGSKTLEKATDLIDPFTDLSTTSQKGLMVKLYFAFTQEAALENGSKPFSPLSMIDTSKINLQC
ncbi:hypothetical protein C8R44DRAFT_753511 [Mycena epipterygia]|nr:hypothetical protein C8R44DRAFT_753511 [Mycena epipterygia]